MTNEFPNLEKIEDYLHGNMPQAERASFEQKLAENSSLKKEFNLVKDMLGGIEHFGDEALKAQIAAAQQELTEEGFFVKKNAGVVELDIARRTRIWRWAVAASLLVLCGAGLFFWLKKSDPSQRAYAQYFQPETSKLAIAMDEASAEGLLPADRERRRSLATGLQFYQTKNYEAAEAALSAHRQQFPQDTVAQFYLALSELHLSNVEKAIALLRPIAPETLKADAGEQGLNFQHESNWYLALAYLKRPDSVARDSALLLLRRIEQGSDSVYREKAQDIRLIFN